MVINIKVMFGVPQDFHKSSWATAFFTVFVYLLNLCIIIDNGGINCHCYGDDTQLYVSTKPGDKHHLNNAGECAKQIRH